METLLTFNEVIEQAREPHLLLGNGFSIAYDKDRFSFTSLLDSAVSNGIINKESELYRLFQKLNTADFESVMRLLDESLKVVDIYTGNEKAIKKVASDAAILKDYLVKIITNNHPEKASEVSESEKQYCLSFLKKFPGKIYTINYDLLLYWVVMIDESGNYKDGFGDNDESREEAYVVYQNNPGSGFNVHFLHGGLHIFDSDDEIIKRTYNNADINLIEQTRASLDEGKYPVFISEGTSEQKHTKIIHNAYLNHCFRSLKSIGKDLVVFGTLLKRSDRHIMNAILQSKVKNIFVGVSSVENAQHIEHAINAHNEQNPKRKKQLHLYDYRTVDVWGKDKKV